MWAILQQDEADDYVLATGVMHSVRDFCNKAFAEVGVELVWKGEGVEEKGSCAKTGRVLVEVDPRYFRPAEVELLLGDPSKAHRKLGWKHEIGLDALCSEMVQQDLITVAKEHRRNDD
jgi:GDPmannose 4,6-dehydratase